MVVSPNRDLILCAFTLCFACKTMTSHMSSRPLLMHRAAPQLVLWVHCNACLIFSCCLQDSVAVLKKFMENANTIKFNLIALAKAEQ